MVMTLTALALAGGSECERGRRTKKKRKCLFMG